MESEHWVKRDEAARILHCSVALVRWFESHGRLHARRDTRGVVTYARSEVGALARLRAARGTGGGRRGDKEVLRETLSGELAAAAFAMFRVGGTLEDVVIKLKCPPERARQLWQEYRTPIEMPSPADVERARDRLDALVGPYKRPGVAATSTLDDGERRNVTPFPRKAVR